MVRLHRPSRSANHRLSHPSVQGVRPELDGMKMAQAPTKHWNRDTALDQILACQFTCEAGPLERNVAFEWLRKVLLIGPKYLPGQGVWYEVRADSPSGPISAWRHFYVVSVAMDSTADARVWRYGLSNDPPAPYHYGTIQVWARESELALLPVTEVSHV